MGEKTRHHRNILTKDTGKLFLLSLPLTISFFLFVSHSLSLSLSHSLLFLCKHFCFNFSIHFHSRTSLLQRANSVGAMISNSAIFCLSIITIPLTFLFSFSSLCLSYSHCYSLPQSLFIHHCLCTSITKFTIPFSFFLSLSPLLCLRFF